MLPALSTRTARGACALSQHARRLATHVPVPASADASSSSAGTIATANVKEGALRPHLGVEVNPNHGLFAFFRRKEKDGVVTYDTVEPLDTLHDKSGRSWKAAELRRKSFKDLHTLWYVVLRERNLLATQRAEARRMGANELTLGLWAKAFRCRKTMARIKYVINERRLAYEGAAKIHAELGEQALAQGGGATTDVRAVIRQLKDARGEDPAAGQGRGRQGRRKVAAAKETGKGGADSTLFEPAMLSMNI